MKKRIEKVYASVRDFIVLTPFVYVPFLCLFLLAFQPAFEEHTRVARAEEDFRARQDPQITVAAYERHLDETIAIRLEIHAGSDPQTWFKFADRLRWAEYFIGPVSRKIRLGDGDFVAASRITAKLGALQQRRWLANPEYSRYFGNERMGEESRKWYAANPNFAMVEPPSVPNDFWARFGIGYIWSILVMFPVFGIAIVRSGKQLLPELWRLPLASVAYPVAVFFLPAIG